MKVCIPVSKNEGVKSKVYDHFGSAPLFIIVDSETLSAETVSNQDHVHRHGRCNPVAAIGGRDLDAVIVGGIGGRALERLNRDGITVYRSSRVTVGDAIAQLNEGRLPEMVPADQCAGHHSGSVNCAH